MAAARGGEAGAKHALTRRLAQIMRTGADVVGLQEIRRPIDRKHPPSGCADMFADLQDLLPLYEAEYHTVRLLRAGTRPMADLSSPHCAHT